MVLVDMDWIVRWVLIHSIRWSWIYLFIFAGVSADLPSGCLLIFDLYLGLYVFNNAFVEFMIDRFHLMGSLSKFIRMLLIHV